MVIEAKNTSENAPIFNPSNIFLKISLMRNQRVSELIKDFRQVPIVGIYDTKRMKTIRVKIVDEQQKRSGPITET